MRRQTPQLSTQRVGRRTRYARTQHIRTNPPLLAPTTTACQRQHRCPQQHRHAIEGQGKGKGQGTLFSVLTMCSFYTLF